MPAGEKLEAVVIGSGFGGAISACRLGKRWPGRVLLLERGKRYPMGSFPRSPHDVSRMFWNVPEENRGRPRGMDEIAETGLFDIRNYKKMDVVLSAGLGGGSLIYANVFMIPPDDVFDARWPATCHKSHLMPYYRVAKEVLGARPIPAVNGDPRREILRTRVFQKAAQRAGRKSELVDINVYFGNDFQKPLPIGQQDRNRYGALQTSCLYCAECDVGCNYHAKNTLDLNYLYVAEHRYQVQVLTEHGADKIVPLNARDEDDPSADGSHGYRVYYRNLTAQTSPPLAVIAQRVVVSAGTLGSTELLLRCKQIHKSLPGVSNHLGKSFSGNGDFLSLVFGAEDPADPNYGPVITQRTDYNLFENFDPEQAFILEDAAFPGFAAWFVEGFKPRILWLARAAHTLKAMVAHFFRPGSSLGSFGYALSGLLSADTSYHGCVLLCMGVDKSNGTMALDRNGWLYINWPQQSSMPLYQAILTAGKNFRRMVQGRKFVPMPGWWWPFRNNVTVHPLGGCVLANDAERGTTSAQRSNFGEVFGYRGLYVADGSLIPSAVGANPCATISALSEMVAEGITGIAPDSNL